MSEHHAMEPEHIAAADGYETLGPAYFKAREIAERAMAPFEAEHFKPLIDKFADDFRDKLWSSVQDSLICDVETNIQNELWRTIDGAVFALLSGDRWALERYALGTRYEQEKVREAVAKHIPQELQDKRILELQERVAELEKSLEFERRMNRT